MWIGRAFECDGNFHFSPRPHDSQLCGPAERPGGEPVIESVRIIDGLTIDPEDEGTGLDTSPPCWTAGGDRGDQRAGGSSKAEAVGDFLGDCLQLGPEPGTFDRSTPTF